MLTVLDAINLTTDYFTKKQIESPRLNAELILSSVLELKRLDLYLQFERPLNHIEKTKYRDLLKRRSEGEPIQYLLGFTEFYGEKFLVNRNVLIPRPETELLVEKIISENFTLEEIRILDIGTGSGNIPIIIKKNIPNAEITSIDISENAIEIARKNEEIILKTNKINFLNLDIFDEEKLKSLGKYDIIVSNPPYVSEDEYPNLQIEIVNYEPKNAITDGKDGIEFYRQIEKRCMNLLNGNGKIYLEIGKDQENSILNLFDDEYFDKEKVKDYSGIYRILKLVRK